MKWYRAKFRSLDGWLRWGPNFDNRESAVEYAVAYANAHMWVIEFDVVRA